MTDHAKLQLASENDCHVCKGCKEACLAKAGQVPASMYAVLRPHASQIDAVMCLRIATSRTAPLCGTKSFEGRHSMLDHT